MEYTKLGESTLEVSRIAFGAWAIGGWMWGGTDMKAAVAAIHAALDHGMTTIDTAPIYGYGLSEEIVGEALRGRPRDRVQILTKFGLRWDLKHGDLHMRDVDEKGRVTEVYKCATPESVIHECEQCLRRLRTDYIDLFQIHWPDANTPIADTMEALALLKKQGKIREAGVSNYSAAQLAEAAETLEIASDQVPYSMVHRDIEADLVPYCLAHPHAIIAYSPMQRGLLTGKFSADHVFKPGDSRPRTRFFKPENIRKVNVLLDKIRPVADDHGISLGQLALCWAIAQPGLTVALAGARDGRQAADNALAGEVRLSAEEQALIAGELETLSLE